MITQKNINALNSNWQKKYIHFTSQSDDVYKNSSKLLDGIHSNLLESLISGRPAGYWFTYGAVWAQNIFSRAYTDIYTAAYSIQLTSSRILKITNEAEFIAFDKKYPNYWFNMDYITLNITDDLLGRNVIHWKPCGISFNPHKYDSINELLETIRRTITLDNSYTLLHQHKLIFDNPEDAIANTDFYKQYPINRFKLKRWDIIRADYDVVIFEIFKPSSSVTMEYFWYQLLDVVSGCILHPIPENFTKINFNDNIVGGDNISDEMMTAIYYEQIMTGGSAIKMNKNIDPINEFIVDEIRECSLLVPTDAPTCLTKGAINTLKTDLNIIADNINDKAIVDVAKSKTGCKTEKCVAEKLLTGSEKTNELARFKLNGPADSTLLSNFDVDGQLQQWANGFPQFYPYNFNMANFTEMSYRNGRIIHEPDTLATISIVKLFANGYTMAGCIINDDQYTGGGTHWMALFVDMRDVENMTIEFFNSANIRPQKSFDVWLTKTSKELLDAYPSSNAHKICVCKINHQQSQTECGLYSLFYIWSRINGVPYEYFMTHRVPDEKMHQFRLMLFNDPAFKNMMVFNLEEYERMIGGIKWDKMA